MYQICFRFFFFFFTFSKDFLLKIFFTLSSEAIPTFLKGTFKKKKTFLRQHLERKRKDDLPF